AGSTVEEEGHGPRCRVTAVELVGRIGDVGLGLALLVEQANGARRRREIERTVGQGDGLFRCGVRRQTVLLADRREILHGTAGPWDWRGRGLASTSRGWPFACCRPITSLLCERPTRSQNQEAEGCAQGKARGPRS